MYGVEVYWCVEGFLIRFTHRVCSRRCKVGLLWPPWCFWVFGREGLDPYPFSPLAFCTKAACDVWRAASVSEQVG